MGVGGLGVSHDCMYHLATRPAPFPPTPAFSACPAPPVLTFCSLASRPRNVRKTRRARGLRLEASLHPSCVWPQEPVEGASLQIAASLALSLTTRPKWRWGCLKDCTPGVPKAASWVVWAVPVQSYSHPHQD